MGGSGETGQLAARRRVAAVGRARSNLAGWEPSVQRLADLVADAAGVPVSVVSLVTADSQIMLGWAGGEDGAAFEIPLSASLCREVVVTGLPFIARDTAADDRFAGTDPVLVHGVRAYAGFPVADQDGLVLGVVSIARHEPHEWTVGQLTTVDNAAQLFAELLGGANAAAARSDASAVRDSAELRRRVEVLTQQLTRSREEYVRLVGHELRTPLSSIAACAELLTAFGEDLPGDAQELLEAVTRNSDRLRHIINALLDLAALDTGQVVLHYTDVNLAAVLRDAAGGFTEGDLRVEAPDVLMVEADEARIRNVIRALIGNAVMYSHPGGPVTMTLTSTGPLADTGGQGCTACLTVTDHGIGIPLEEFDQVFERFHRGSRVRNLGLPGLGLGLAMSRTVVERHDGTVTVHATPGGGTTAEVRLPLRRH